MPYGLVRNLTGCILLTTSQEVAIDQCVNCLRSVQCRIDCRPRVGDLRPLHWHHRAGSISRRTIVDNDDARSITACRKTCAIYAAAERVLLFRLFVCPSFCTTV